MKAKFVFVLLSLTLAVMASCYGGGKLTPTSTPVSAPTPASAGVSVSIQSFAFVPSSVTINKGTSVTWTNRDAALHTVTGEGFDSGDLRQGQVFTHVFNEIGTFGYHCSFHPSMKGEVIVK